MTYENATGFPSVTQIISPYIDFSAIRPDVLQRACERGTIIHEAAAEYLRGGFPLCPKEHCGYFDSFQRWADVMIQDCVLIEKRITGLIRGYTGQVDLLARLKGDEGLTLIDFKTSATGQKSWRVQLAAYRTLVVDEWAPVGRMMSIRFKKDGKAPIVDEYTTYARDMGIFNGLLNSWNYFKPAKLVDWENV